MGQKNCRHNLVPVSPSLQLEHLCEHGEMQLFYPLDVDQLTCCVVLGCKMSKQVSVCCLSLCDLLANSLLDVPGQTPNLVILLTYG